MKGQILFIDDNEVDVRVATLALKGIDYDCKGFTNFREGLDWLDKNTPLVILLDLQMPGTTGYKLMPIIKAKPLLAKVPIIIVSGKNQVEDVRLAIKSGASDYIIKPIDPMVLQEKVQRVLNSNAGDIAEFSVAPSFAESIHFQQPVILQSISEFGLRVVTTLPLVEGDTFEVGGLNSEHFGMSHVWTRVIQVEKRGGRADFMVKLSFIGISEKERQMIRRTCRQIWVLNKQEEMNK